MAKAKRPNPFAKGGKAVKTIKKGTSVDKSDVPQRKKKAKK